MVRSIVPAKPNTLSIHGFADQHLMLISETVVSVRLQREYVSVHLFATAESPSILGPKALCALGDSFTPQALLLLA